MRIDTAGRVLDLDLKPIPGLYAAGELVGGIFYNNYPGGTGLSEGFLENASPILQGALELVSDCPCAQGCPSCIGPVGAGFQGAGAASSELPAGTGKDAADRLGNPKESIREFLELWLGKNTGKGV